MEDPTSPHTTNPVDESVPETVVVETNVDTSPEQETKATVKDCPEVDTAEQQQQTSDSNDELLQDTDTDTTTATNEQSGEQVEQPDEEQDEENALQDEITDEQQQPNTTEKPFLEEDVSLTGKTAEEMKALLESIVDSVSSGQIQAQKDAHDKEILEMQGLMIEAQKDGLLDEDDAEQAEEIDEDGNVKQSAHDGSIMLKNTSGTHNPILDDLRKKQKRGQLSKEEEVLLAKVLDYQQRMTGAVGATKDALEQQEQQNVATPEKDVDADGKTSTFGLPFDIYSAAVRGTTMPLVPLGPGNLSTLAGNSLVTGVRISLSSENSVAKDTTFVLGTIRGGHPQDPDNKPQRWVDVSNPLTIAELQQNRGSIDIECNENDVIFNPAMVGITVLKGDLPKNSLSVSVHTVPLDEDEEVPVGAFGPTSSATNSQKDQKALLAAQQRQKAKTNTKTNGSAKPTTALQKALDRQTVAPTKQPAVKRLAPSLRRNADDDDNDEDEEFDAVEAAADETHTLKPQLPPNNNTLPSAPTRKQIAADPNNPKFDPTPIKDRLNRFSTNENGELLATDLPPGVAGYAADGTVIPIVNDGDNFNPQIPDVFGDRDYRNQILSSTYVPEKDKPIFFNPKIKYAVISVIGPKHCRVKTDRCVARIWGFAKNKKQCGSISKWVRQNAYMGKIWDLGVVPIDTWWPVPPIYAENATSTYSNRLHREYMEAFLNEQKRATVELEQRVLDERLNSEKKGNTIDKQLGRQETARKTAAHQIRKQGKRTAPPLSPSSASASTAVTSNSGSTTHNTKQRRNRAPVTQRIK